MSGNSLLAPMDLHVGQQFTNGLETTESFIAWDERTGSQQFEIDLEITSAKHHAVHPPFESLPVRERAVVGVQRQPLRSNIATQIEDDCLRMCLQNGIRRKLQCGLLRTLVGQALDILARMVM